MIKLTVHRVWFTDKSTQGSLDVNGVYVAYTLEPPTRTDDVKPRAIPTGCYELAMLPSARFKHDMPHVVNVPGFTEIEIHPGNFPSDTHGCLLVGKIRTQDAVLDSDTAFNELLQQLDSKQDMEIEYVEERAVSA